MNFSFWPFLWFGLLGRLLILTEKKPHVRNFCAHESGAGNGHTNSMAPGIFWFFLLENPHALKISRFLGGLGFFGGGGGGANFVSMGAGIFLILESSLENPSKNPS